MTPNQKFLLTGQLEIDIRMIRYIGHVTRMPEDRWEYKLLFGRLKKEKGVVHTKGKDAWWERVRILLKEVMAHHREERPWYEVAKDKVTWKNLSAKWKKERVAEERHDTQASREARWLIAAKGFRSATMAEKVWEGIKDPDATGTPLEGPPILWLKQLVLVGGVPRQGWMDGVDKDWKWAVNDESSKRWLEREGGRIKRRIRGKKWEDILSGISADPQVADRVMVRIRNKAKQEERAVEEGATPMAPPPRPPVGLTGGAAFGRRLRGEQKAPDSVEREGEVRDAGPTVDRDGRIRCEACGNWIKPISMTQHVRLYCPNREHVELPGTRRKILRPTSPKVAKAGGSELAMAQVVGPPLPRLMCDGQSQRSSLNAKHHHCLVKERSFQGLQGVLRRLQ